MFAELACRRLWKLGIIKAKNSEEWRIGDEGLLTWAPLPEPYEGRTVDEILNRLIEKEEENDAHQ